MQWPDVADEFVWDGSWRDIYVLDANVAAWEAFLTALPRWGYAYTFSSGGTDSDLPTPPEIFSSWEDAGPLLTIQVGGVLLNCHFFTEDELEFDLDPREVRGQQELDDVLEFMGRLGDATQRSVVMTPENGPRVPFIRYDPARRTHEWVTPANQQR